MPQNFKGYALIFELTIRQYKLPGPVLKSHSLGDLYVNGALGNERLTIRTLNPNFYSVYGLNMYSQIALEKVTCSGF